MFKKMIVLMLVLGGTLTATAGAQNPLGEDVFGRSPERQLSSEDLRRVDEPLRQEMMSLDKSSQEMRNRTALAKIELEDGRIVTMVREGGEVELDMKKARFDLDGEPERQRGWEVRSGTCTVPAKPKPLKIAIKAPNGAAFEVVCKEDLERLAGGEKVVFSIVPLSNGDLYCPKPVVGEAPAAAGESGG